MKYFDVNQVLDKIDENFGYVFEGKNKDDHLISNKTWNKYTREYTGVHKIIVDDEIQGGTRWAQYREDFVEKVIEYKKNALIAQFNSDRKTTLDYELINELKTFNVKPDKTILNKRIPITLYNSREKSKYAHIKENDVKEQKEKLWNYIIDELINTDKIENDAVTFSLNGAPHNLNAKDYLK